MTAFTDAEYARMSELESRARLADLEIERTKLRDIGKLDIANMTAGEIVTLANVMEAVHVLTDAIKRDAQESPYGRYATPSTSERRTFPFDSSTGAYKPTGAAYYGDIPAGDDSEGLAKLREAILARLAENGAQVNTVSGPISVADVPRDENGRVNEDWLNANCTCDDHERMRIEADRKKDTGDPSIAAGLYL
jgi:hypothetical protein